MPTVAVNRDHLFEAIGQTYTEEEFEDLCFDFGIELDEVTSEKNMALKETGQSSQSHSEDVIYKIDVPANRYDLLCVEGLSMALRVFLEKEKPPLFKSISVKDDTHKIVVKPETKQIRPYVVCAVLRGLKFTEASYKSFIDLQDKLHHNICRRRTLVAIGTHDLDTIKGPFSYEARAPKDISFAPLNQTKVMNGEELMQFYENDLHLKKFLPIIKDSPVYPVIYDATGKVLSLPPIINGNHSKITLNTTNVFIECTATDLTKAKIVLNTMIAMFSQYCADPFSCEEVEVVAADGSSHVLPNMAVRPETCSVDYIQSSIGADIKTEDVARLLNKMMLSAELSPDHKQVSVAVPVTRSDILHACDIMEDVAIAFGFNNIPRKVPEEATVGRQLPMNKLCDLLRAEVAQAGYDEVLTFALCGRGENFSLLRRPDDGSAVVNANPKTTDFQVARTTLLSGLLKTIASNKRMPLPIKLFEFADVVVKDSKNNVGARNIRRFSAIHAAKTSGFEHVHGLVDRFMQVLGVPSDAATGYSIRESTDPAFFPGRAADILYKGKSVGVFGILHPEVLQNFEVPFPSSALEIDMTPFLEKTLSK